jgi:hypothetical protein
MVFHRYAILRKPDYWATGLLIFRCRLINFKKTGCLSYFKVFPPSNAPWGIISCQANTEQNLRGLPLIFKPDSDN